MDNPFVYGESVSGECFCNRKTEIEKLENDIISCQKIFIISSRKLGKTSLIRTVLERLKKRGFLTVFLDIEAFASYKEFLDTFLLALTQLTTPFEKILSFLKELIPGLRAELKINEDGHPSLSIGYDFPSPALDKISQKIYDLPEIIAKKYKKKVLIVFDEFQEILKLDGEKIEGKMRASIQHQRNASYVFAGSKKHLLADMVNSPDRPFYKIGPILPIEKIPEKEFFNFIKRKFYSARVKISDEIINKIIERADNVPYYVQMFCHELWDFLQQNKKPLKESLIEDIISRLVSQNSSNFYLEWSRLILSKRQVLKAIALNGGRRVLSEDYLKDNQLGFPSKVKGTLTALVDEGYLDREKDEYLFNDLLFCEWIKKQHSSQAPACF